MDFPPTPIRSQHGGAPDGSDPQNVTNGRRAEVIRNALSRALGMGERIAVLVVSVDSVPPSLDLLHPLERPALRRAVDKRVREFVAGRVLARQAARLLGLAELVLPMGRNRAPEWPAGIVGSITHNRHWCAVAMARMDDVAGLGVDLEDHPGVPETLAAEIMTSREIETYNRLGQRDQDLMRSFVFSAKEAAFKAQYNLTGTPLYFQDVDIEIDMNRLWFRTSYQSLKVREKLQAFSQSCRLFYMDDIVGSAVTITTSAQWPLRARRRSLPR
jgi:4'-phosphopantetheinyl transferase EntD